MKREERVCYAEQFVEQFMEAPAPSMSQPSPLASGEGRGELTGPRRHAGDEAGRDHRSPRVDSLRTLYAYVYMSW